MTAKIIVSKSALEAEFKTVSQCKTADYCKGFNDALKTILDNSQVVNSEPVSKVEIPTNKAILPNGVAVSNVYEAYEVGLKQALQSSEPVGYIDEFGNFENSLKQWMIEEPNVTWSPLFTTPQPAPDTVPRAEYNKLLEAHKKIIAIELIDQIGGNTGNEYCVNSNKAWNMQRISKIAIAEAEGK